MKPLDLFKEKIASSFALRRQRACCYLTPCCVYVYKEPPTAPSSISLIIFSITAVSRGIGWGGGGGGGGGRWGGDDNSDRDDLLLS